MKTSHLIILIIVSAILQVSFFYTDVGSISINLILIITWFLYFNQEKDYSAFYVFFAGTLTDILSLRGIGVTATSILLPLILYIFFERLFSLRDNFFSYLVMLIMIILSKFILIGLFLIFLSLDSKVIDLDFLQPMVISGMINWVIVTLFTVVRIMFTGTSEYVSFVGKSSNK